MSERGRLEVSPSGYIVGTNVQNSKGLLIIKVFQSRRKVFNTISYNTKNNNYLLEI